MLHYRRILFPVDFSLRCRQMAPLVGDVARKFFSEVVLLHDLDDWRHARIAEVLEISEVNSRRHLSDARKQLRALLRASKETTDE